MVVDGFDANSLLSHRLDQPIRLAVVGLPLLVIRAYGLLDIEALESWHSRAQTATEASEDEGVSPSVPRSGPRYPPDKHSSPRSDVFAPEPTPPVYRPA
jgi:hypothetical protein